MSASVAQELDEADARLRAASGIDAAQDVDKLRTEGNREKPITHAAVLPPTVGLRRIRSRRDEAVIVSPARTLQRVNTDCDKTARCRSI